MEAAIKSWSVLGQQLPPPSGAQTTKLGVIRSVKTTRCNYTMSASSSTDSKRPQQPSRFQRRVSERNYYEGHFKPSSDSNTGTAPNLGMDHPDPWASPKQSRNGFGDADLTPAQLPPPHEQDAEDTGAASSAAQHNHETNGSPYRYRGPTNPEQQYQYQQQQPQQQQQQQYGQESYRPQSARYHHAPQQQQQQQYQQHQQQQQQSQHRAPPQYKLSAKITGLERTGRKDPYADPSQCSKLHIH